MKNESESTSRDAATLLRFAIQPQSPYGNPEYRILLQRYEDETNFRKVVNEISQGLLLRIIDADVQYGITVIPEEDSPFAVKLSDLQKANASADDRLVAGLVQIGIASYMYPGPEDLEEDPNTQKQSITVSEIENHLEELSKILENEVKSQSDPASLDVYAGLIESWRVWRKLPQSEKLQSKQRIIKRQFQELQKLGLFIEDRDAYRPLRRYQVQIREVAAQETFRVVAKLLKDHSE